MRSINRITGVFINRSKRTTLPFYSNIEYDKYLSKISIVNCFEILNIDIDLGYIKLGFDRLAIKGNNDEYELKYTIALIEDESFIKSLSRYNNKDCNEIPSVKDYIANFITDKIEQDVSYTDKYTMITTTFYFKNISIL